jgi:aminopeptidase-like protein
VKYLRFALIVLSLTIVAYAQVARTNPMLEKLIRAVRAEVNGNRAMDFVLRLYETDRWVTFPKFEETAKYLEETMVAIGLQDVERVELPADGETQYGFWTMPLAWDVTDATLEIIEPAVPSDLRVLANYRQVPASLVMWSGPTAPGGIEAEVVEIGRPHWGQLDRLDVAGKMVLVDPPADLSQRGALKAELYRRGASGMISYATAHPHLPDEYYWLNAWGDHGWAFTKSSSPLVGFSITPSQGAYVRELLAGGAKVRVRAVVESRHYSGSYPYVTAVIRGSGSDEEVLQLGHAYEVGANDNSTGVAAMIESMAALNRLIEAGKLERPRRSIRILAMPEYYGSMAYAVTQPERIARTIAALCVDTPAGPYDAAGTSFAFQLNPDVARSYQDALIVRVAENYYAGGPRRFPRWVPYRPTTDTYYSDPTIGVPTVAARGGTGVSVHHTSADTVGMVDHRSLRDLSSMIAVYLYFVAAAADDEIPWLAEISVSRGYENMVRAAAPHLDRIVAAADAATVGQELFWALAKIKHSADRDREAVLSALRLGSSGRRDEIRRSLDPQLESLQRFADDQSQRLRRAADRRASELGSATPVKEVAPPADPRRAEASRMVVVRKRAGAVTLDDLPLKDRQGFPGFAGNPSPVPIFFWCDGKRTLEEVIRLIELEQGPVDFDFVGYVKFLAGKGYIDLILK